jgi:hypothetical protein
MRKKNDKRDNTIIILLGIILLAFIVIYKSELSYFINKQILNKFSLEPIDQIGTSLRLFYLLATTIAIFLIWKTSPKLSILIIYAVMLVCWLYTWTSPFSEGKDISIIYQKNTKWYYNDFKPIGDCVRSNVGWMFPIGQRDLQNFILFENDSLHVIQNIKFNLIEFTFDMSSKIYSEGKNIQFQTSPIRATVKFSGLDDEIFLTNINNINDFSYLDQFPSLSQADKTKIETTIGNNFLFQYRGDIAIFIADVNNRGGDGYSFDCLLYDHQRRLFYAKFSEDGYFNQVKN